MGVGWITYHVFHYIRMKPHNDKLRGFEQCALMSGHRFSIFFSFILSNEVHCRYLVYALHDRHPEPGRRISEVQMYMRVHTHRKNSGLTASNCSRKNVQKRCWVVSLQTIGGGAGQSNILSDLPSADCREFTNPRYRNYISVVYTYKIYK